MTKHTPTPWTLTPEPHASWIASIGNNTYDPQLWSVATPYPKGDKQADAAFIVKAVNSYEALTDALRAALKALEAANIAGQSLYGSEVANRARALLAELELDEPANEYVRDNSQFGMGA